MDDYQVPIGGGTAPELRPVSARITKMALLFQFVFPALALVLSLVVETPTGDAIDWDGKSLPARALDALFFAHFVHAGATVTFLRGRRWIAVAVNLVILPASCLVNFFGYFAVTGIYL